MNATEFSLPLDSLIRELQGEADTHYQRLCRLEDALLALAPGRCMVCCKA